MEGRWLYCRLHPSALDYGLVGVYFLVVLGIGLVARLTIKTDVDFFLSGRSLPAGSPAWRSSRRTSRRSRSSGSRRTAREYGVATVHYYWIGAVLRDGLPRHRDDAVLLRRESAQRARVPAPALQRQTHFLNAASFAVATVLISGVNLYALALIMHLMLGWSISFAIVIAAVIVLGYITLGGLTSAIYNEVLQSS